MTKRKTGVTKKTAPVKASAQWSFPKNTLEDSIRVPKIIEEKNAGNPMHGNDLRAALGYSASDWRFSDLLKSAKLYGLVSGAGPTSVITIEPNAQEIITPSSPKERRDALLKAFRNVVEFKQVEEFYGGKKIPEDEFFYNILIRNFNITKDRVDKFAEIFLTNINYLKAFNITFSKENNNSSDSKSDDGEFTPDQNGPQGTGFEKSEYSNYSGGRDNSRIRKYLDTCFVMMPFGEWFDQYYKEIYIPAIKDASFEPVRADELFSTGSVVEQIWEQINKAKILIAELTGKNANVFYELGLAHAAVKPVIFISSSVEDVPFDLRHLRVIIYDIREPNWADKLKNRITDYLRNALKEPAKSIPHPFRLAQNSAD